MESAFRDCIRQERVDGCTVLLSSHILAEAEALSDRVSIINNGRIVETGSLEQMRHLSRTSITATMRRSPDGLTQLPGLHSVAVDGTRLTCEVDAAGLDDLLIALGTVGVVSLVSQPPTLEDLFLRHYSQTGTS